MLHQVTKRTPRRGGTQLFAREADHAAHEARDKAKCSKCKKQWHVGWEVQEVQNRCDSEELAVQEKALPLMSGAILKRAAMSFKANA